MNLFLLLLLLLFQDKGDLVERLYFPYSHLFSASAEGATLGIL